MFGLFGIEYPPSGEMLHPPLGCSYILSFFFFQTYISSVSPFTALCVAEGWTPEVGVVISTSPNIPTSPVFHHSGHTPCSPPQATGPEFYRLARCVVPRLRLAAVASDSG
jgi:hypothetical protein